MMRMFFRVEATHAILQTCVSYSKGEVIFLFSQQAEKDFIQSLYDKSDTCTSSFHVTIKFFHILPKTARG